MLECTDDVPSPSEFADEYQDWLEGNSGSPRAQWFDYPLKKLTQGVALVIVKPGDVVAHVVADMARHERGTALVMEGERLIGIFTERDLLRRVIAEGRDVSSTRMAEVMSENPETLPDSANLAQAMRLLARARYRHVPVIDAAGRPVGMLSTRHVIAFVSDTFPKEILNAPPERALAVARKEGA